MPKLLFMWDWAKKKKFDKNILNTLILNNILPKPLWFLKLIFSSSSEIYRLHQNPRFKTKNMIGKLDILKTNTKDACDWYLMQKTLDLSFLTGKRIFIKNRKIWTNFTGLNNLVYDARFRYGFYTFASQTTIFNGRPHQTFINQNNFGFNYTTSDHFFVNDQKISTLPACMPKASVNQRVLYGYFADDLRGTKQFNAAFF